METSRMNLMPKLEVSNRWVQLCHGTWVDILENAAKKWPTKEAIVMGDRRIDYRAYMEEVNRLAKGLHRIGVRKGDHVALWMTNRPEWCYSRFAIYRLGAILVPLSTRYRASDLEYVLNHCDAKFLILEGEFLKGFDAMGTLSELCPELKDSQPEGLKLAKFPQLKKLICLGEKQKGCFNFQDVSNISADKEDVDIQAEIRCDDVSHIIYTSGTTGFPKGVESTHMNSISHMAIATELYQLEENGRFLNMMPYFGNIGLGNMSFPIIVGATSVSMVSFTSKQALETIQKERITNTITVPTMLVDILAEPEFDTYDLSSLKYVGCAGAYLPSSVIQECRTKLNITPKNLYGLVEAAGIVTWMPEGADDEHIERSIGLPLPYCELSIRNVNTDEELRVGEEGEICTKEVFQGAQFMKGYYKQPELTSQVIRNGWLHTGDLGKKDKDGYFYITGRVKEMFTVGGFNVSPAEVEEFLLRHPKIEAVSVVGVPDLRLGEVGAAFVRLKKGEFASEPHIIEYCKAGIANEKTPRYIFFVDTFPLNPQGKVQKFKQREWAIEKLGLKERE
jgi:fatty-acyl-CoA synthase